MQLTRLAAAALLALAPSVAFAVTEADFAAKTTGDLVNLCAADAKEPMGTAALNFCHGFAQGAVSVVMQRHPSAPSCSASPILHRRAPRRSPSS
jgi:hypothetical protein